MNNSRRRLRSCTCPPTCPMYIHARPIYTLNKGRCFWSHRIKTIFDILKIAEPHLLTSLRPSPMAPPQRLASIRPHLGFPRSPTLHRFHRIPSPRPRSTRERREPRELRSIAKWEAKGSQLPLRFRRVSSSRAHLRGGMGGGMAGERELTLSQRSDLWTEKLTAKSAPRLDHLRTPQQSLPCIWA